MAIVAFMNAGMEIHKETLPEMSYKPGDPMPVALIEAAQSSWAKKLGYGDNPDSIVPGTTWAAVKVNGHEFSHTRFLEAAKNPGAATEPALAKPLDNKPVVKQLTGEPPESWSLEPENGISIKSRTHFAGKPEEDPGPILDSRGRIDWDATNERDFRADLAKLGTKPRPLRPQGS